MAYTSFMRGDNTKMTNTPYTDGLIFLNTEEQALYLDDNNERIPMGGAGTGGHIIENNAGTDMTERTNLQFGGVYVSDDETNDRTKVNVTRNMTKDDFDQLTNAEKLGVIVTSNDPNDYVPFSADMVEYDNTNSGMTATDVQDAIDELNSELGSICTFTQYTLLDTINYSTSGSVSYIIPSIEEYKFLCFRFKYDDTTDVYYSFSKAELFLGTHRQLMVDNGRVSVELVDNTHIKIWGEDTFKICKLYGVK